MSHSSSSLSNQCLALEMMGIKVWSRPEIINEVFDQINTQITEETHPSLNSYFELKDIYKPNQPKYLVVLGMEGTWDNPNKQAERRQMFKKLLQAINWQWPESYVVEFKGAPDTNKLTEVTNQLSLEKVIIFGKDLKDYIESSLIPTVFLPSFDQLTLDLSFKREAWEALKKFA